MTIVYDNYACDPRFRVGSGFACLLRCPRGNVLFDTGAHGPTLLHNIQAAGLDPERVDAVVLSHLDSDHAGGLFKFLEANRTVSVYVAGSVPGPFKDLVALQGAKVVSVSRTTRLWDAVYILGQTGVWLKEQALAVRTSRGLVLVVADAHPGVAAMVRKARRSLGAPVYAVLGGFHLESATERELGALARSFRQLGVQAVGPCHSSGDLARQVFRQAYREGFIPAGVGLELMDQA